MLRKMFTKGTASETSGSDKANHSEGVASSRPQKLPSPLDKAGALGGAIAEAELTSEYLLRVVEELPMRVRSLCDANAAALFELSNLHTVYAGVKGQLDEITRSNRSLSTLNSELAAALREARERADSHWIELGVVRAERHDLAVRLQATEDERSGLSQRVSELEALARQTENQLEWSNALQRKSNHDLKDAQNQLALARETIESEKTLRAQEAAAFGQEILSLRKDRDDAGAENATLRAGGVTREKRLREAMAAAQAGEERRALLEAEVRRIHEAHATLFQRYEALEEDSSRQVRERDVKNDAVASKCVLLEQMLATARAQCRSVTNELMEANGEIRTTRQNNQTLLNEIDRLSAELASVRSRVSQKEEAARALSQDNEALVLQVREAQLARIEAERRADVAVDELTDATANTRRVIEDLQRKYEIASGDVSRLKSERALLAGQLDVARKGKWEPPPTQRADDDPDNVFVLQSKPTAKSNSD